MTCHNRRQQLINTLNSIAFYYNQKNALEVIIVDDSDDPKEKISDLPGRYLFPVFLMDVPYKNWINSCVAYNIAFNKISGSTVIIQNAECMHIGNILKYTEENSRTGLYITYGAYSLDYPLGEVDFKKDKEALFKTVVSNPYTHLQGHKGWYNHTRFRPVKYHFCSAISRTDLENLNGFDERYGLGIAHDDCEILVRIENAGIESTIVNIPFIIHQWHKRTNARRDSVLWQRNFHLYNEKTLKENLVKAPENEYYVR